MDYYNYEYNERVTARGTARKNKSAKLLRGNCNAKKGDGIDGKVTAVQLQLRHEDYIRRMLNFCKANNIKSANNSDVRQSDVIRAALDYIIDNNIRLF